MAAVAVFAIHVTTLPTGPEPVAPVAGAPADLKGIARGEYLARAADCVACHTAPGGKPFAGGLPFKLPFGTITSTNITPDRETGIGRWNDDQFVRAVREGVGSQGNLYPAMPYTSYAGLSREDVVAIKEYLFSLDPVHQSMRPTELAFPFNQRWGLKLWNLAFFREQRFIPEAAKDEAWNRGGYLATALGHCAECHTPRNISFALKPKENFSGTEVQGWKAYNGTSDRAYGIGDWTDRQLADFLSKGHAEGRSSAVGPMAEVVENSLQYLTKRDIGNLVAYLRDVPEQAGERGSEINLKPALAARSSAILPPPTETANDNRGRTLFQAECASCHQWNGAGRQTAYASLSGSRSVNDPNGNSVVQVILKGTSIEIAGQRHAMPGFPAHSDIDVATLANYVIAHFGEKQGLVTAEQVRRQRSQ